MSTTVTPAESILHRPTLGHPALLGELYDVRTDQFLNVQMYSQKDMEAATSTTNVNHVDFQVKMSNSFQDKTNLLDISAELSASILGGLISIKGSGHYISDAQSNSQERSWVVNLKARLKEDRLRFTEIASPLKSIITDYLGLEKAKATHFVSGIVYGGNLVVSLRTKKSDSSEKETITGNLDVAIDKFKGLFEFQGKAKAEIENTTKELNDTFDVSVYGDFPSSDPLPTTAEEVLTFLPGATAKFSTGVPVSVTLQPIPPTLLQSAQLSHKIDEVILDNILSNFAALEDVKARFSVLNDHLRDRKSFVPKLASAVATARSEFSREYGRLLERLKDCIYKLRTEPASVTHTSLVDAASKLYNFHVPNNSVVYHAPVYPTSLLGLEQAFTEFHDLQTSVVSVGSQFSLARDALANINKMGAVPYVVIPPLGPTPTTVLLRNTHFIRSQSRLFPKGSLHVVYFETSQDVTASLPGTQPFDPKTGPQLLLSQVKEGRLTWLTGHDARNVNKLEGPDYGIEPDFCFDAFRYRSGAAMTPKLKGIDGTQSFTIVLLVRWTSLEYLSHGLPAIHVLNAVGAHAIRISFRPYPTAVSDTGVFFILEDPGLGMPMDKPFQLSFVQDLLTNKRALYLNASKVAEQDINTSVPLHTLRWEELRVDVTELPYYGLVEPSDAMEQYKRDLAGGFHVQSIRAYARAIVPGLQL